MTAPRDDSPTRHLTLTSSAFRDGESIPVRHTCDGEDLSPPLGWTGAPVETRTFALVCDDPDAPRGTWVHWLIWNLPADAVELGQGVPPPPELPSGARQGINDGGDLGYGGPCPPPGKPHRYFFRLYALDTALNLPPGVQGPDLEAAMAGHILAEGTTMGIYERRKG
jgi:Raf kinase inhibitor-like YbhB/YbcL family protein